MTIYNQISSNKTRTFIIFFLFIIFVTGFFYFLGKFIDNSNTYLFIGIIFSLSSSFISYFYSDKIVLFTVGAKPANKKEFFDFYTVTENLAMAAGIPMPKLYVIQDKAPNAFATGRNPHHAVVCATTGLLELLDRTELEGVVAHELSHVKNYDILLASIVSVLVGSVVLISDWMMRGFLWGNIGGNDNDRDNRNPIMLILFIVFLILMPIVATLIQLALSRQREYLADASGGLITRYPEGLARALDKISAYPASMRHATSSTAHLFIANPFKKGKGMGSWLQSLFSTHPPIEERIRILRAM